VSCFAGLVGLFLNVLVGANENVDGMVLAIFPVFGAFLAGGAQGTIFYRIANPTEIEESICFAVTTLAATFCPFS
jgi:hypothetical protein